MIDANLFNEVYSNHMKNAMGFDRLLLKPSSSGRWLALWGKDKGKLLPGFVRTHPVNLGHDGPKYFRSVDFYGTGECYARILVDGTVRAEGKVVMAEHYTPARQIGLPRGTCGTDLSIELLGNASPRFFEVDWNPVGGK